MTSINPTPALTPDDLILKAEALAEKATPEMIEAACRAAYGKHWDGPADRMPGEPMKRVWRDYAAKFLEAGLPFVPALASALRQVLKERDQSRNTLDLHAGDLMSLDNEVLSMREQRDEAESALAVANRRINGLVEALKRERDKWPLRSEGYIALDRALASTPAPAQETKT